MEKGQYRVLGLMSGTSLDGLDLALCWFNKTNQGWQYRMEATQHLPYSAHWVQLLSELPNASGPEIQRLNAAYGRFLGQHSKTFLSKHPGKVDFLASHGHTIFHRPDLDFTYQLGSGAHLSISSGFPVVSDFRTADVALGGQGAPLVPIGDRLLFSDYAQCLNLGGFANVSFEQKGNRVAYDIGPANLVLNHCAQLVGKAYDKDGQLAQSGVVIPKLLATLNALDYYQQPPPKSLGREWIDLEVFPILKPFETQAVNLARTCCEHLGQQIGKALTKGPEGKILVTGGGAYHGFLIEIIRQHCPYPIELPDSQLIDYKEALIFAFLGVLRWRKENNCLASATGAKTDHSSGVIHFPKY